MLFYIVHLRMFIIIFTASSTKRAGESEVAALAVALDGALSQGLSTFRIVSGETVGVFG